MLWLLVVLALTLAALQYRWRRRALYRLHAALAADLPGHPLVGHATLLIGTDEDRMKAFQLIGRAALRQGGLASAWMLNRLYVVVADAAVAGVVARRCLDKDEATMGFIRTLIGNGSIFAPVEIWRPRRKILAPVFGVRRVAAFVGVFDRHAAAAADQLRALAGAGDFSLWDPLSAYTFDAVCETSLGVRLRSQGGAPHPFLRAFAGAQRELARRMCAPWLYPGALYRLLPPHRRFARCRRLIHSFIDEVIRDKRKTMSSLENKESASADADTDSGPASFLELMLQGGEYSERELREEVMVLVMAGSDTTALGAAFTLLLLARHPAVQDRLRRELAEVLGRGDALSAASLARLRYLDAVVREALRLYPPVPVTVREVHEDVDWRAGAAGGRGGAAEHVGHAPQRGVLGRRRRLLPPRALPAGAAAPPRAVHALRLLHEELPRFPIRDAGHEDSAGTHVAALAGVAAGRRWRRSRRRSRRAAASQVRHRHEAR